MIEISSSADASGGPLDPSYQTAIFKKALAKPPAFRGSGSTICATRRRRSCSPRACMSSSSREMLGHATITLTLDTYSHLIPGHAR